jgi:putative membrane protein
MLVPKRAQIVNMILYVGRPALFIFIFDVAIVLGYIVLGWEWVASPHVPLALYGAAVSIIVSKRNASAYARWWEGRQLWGHVINNCRNVARQILSALQPRNADDPAETDEILQAQRRFVQLQMAYGHALRQHLRELSPWPELERLLPMSEVEQLRTSKNVPLTLLQRQAEALGAFRSRGWIDSMTWQAMDRNLGAVTDAQGGCERIKNTPMPKQYDYFPQLFVQVYCLLLPLGMVQNLRWLTPLGSTLVGFMFLALDKIGRDLENPFDNTVHDVPMTSITRNLEITLRQMLGETELPEPELPKRGVLW